MSRHSKHYRSTYTRFNKRNDENRGCNIMFCWRNVKKPCRLYTHSSSMVTLNVNTVVLTENRLLRTFNRVSTPTAKPNQVFITPFARYTLLFSGIPWNFLYGVTRTHVRILYTYVYFCYCFYADITRETHTSRFSSYYYSPYQDSRGSLLLLLSILAKPLCADRFMYNIDSQRKWAF